MKMNFEKMNRDMPIEQEHNKQALLQKLTETSDMDHPIDLEKDLEIQLKQQQTVVDHAMGKSLEASKELRKAPEFKKIFETNCVACHRADGGGAIGPNLTDENWILGGGIKNVFNTLMEGGRPGKGMVAWKESIKPTDLQKVASYVLSLQGTNPKDPKPTEPEAKAWVEEGGAKQAATTSVDSTKTTEAATATK